MTEQLFFRAEDKITRYAELRPQLEALIGSETDAVANMANFCAALKAAFGWFWIGFYIVRGQELILGPFQGPIACTSEPSKPQPSTLPTLSAMNCAPS